MDEDISLDMEGGGEAQSFTGKKSADRKPTNEDPVTFYLMRTYYTINRYGQTTVKVAAIGIPILLLIFFSMFISDKSSNLIAVFAWLMSVDFILISFWILCWILEKDQGTRKM